MNKISKKAFILLIELLKKTRSKGFFLPIQSKLFEKANWYTDKETNNEFLLGKYEEDLSEVIIANLTNGDVFYDLGAHWGYFSLLASSLVGNNGQVVGFEPHPRNFDRLTKNVQKNKRDNIKILQIAASNENGYVDFTDSPDSYANTIKTTTSANSIKVQADTIDNLIKNGYPIPNFMKIDVEGAEYEVLKGAELTILNNKPIIHLSTHDIHVSGVEKKCKNLMTDYGYNLIPLSRKEGIADFICMCSKKE